MFLSAVVLVLQEVIEAALLMGILLVFAHLVYRVRDGDLYGLTKWAVRSVAFGCVGAILYGYFFPDISEWFDYVGIEVMNATSEIVIFLLLILYACMIPVIPNANNKLRDSRVIELIMGVMVVLTITREGSEIFLYISGIVGQGSQFAAALLGGLVGAGTGISAAVLLFYFLILIPHTWAMRISLVLLASAAGNMLSQAVLLLTQADWLPPTARVWDTSDFISESSLTGRILYALLGYESAPSMLQVTVYLTGILAICLTPLMRTMWNLKPRHRIE